MSTVVLLYSKFSKRSLDLMESMEGVIECRKVCIDHPTIRERVMNNTRGIVVREVPCVFLLFPDGRMENFQGLSAYQWLHDTLENIKRFATVDVSPPVQSAPFTELPVQEEVLSPPQLEQVQESSPAMKQVKSSGDSIQNMAAQLQAEREREDEKQHPNAMKIKSQEM